MATYDITQGIPSKIVAGDILNCPYTGTVIELPIPKGVYKLECWGASGEYSQGSSSSTSRAVYYAGAYASGTFTNTAKRSLYFAVGETAFKLNRAKQGCWNGGGAKYGTGDDNGQGGGATHICLEPCTVSVDSYYRYVANAEALNSRILVAGGGGNGRSYNSTMYAGYAPSYTTSISGYSGGMTSSPSQASGVIGGFGYGGTVTSTGDTASSGGGGWYGGGSPGDSYGGGGSSFAWCETYASYVPSTWLLDSSTYLTDVSLICAKDSMPSYSSTSTMTGNQMANGYARVTVIEASSLSIPVNIGGTWKSSDAAYVNIGGVWKEIDSAYINIGGTWKELG